MKPKILLTLFFGLFGGLTSLFAQASDGSIRGQVSDPSGGAIVGARVTVTEQSTGLARTTLSNSQGAYVAAALPPRASMTSKRRRPASRNFARAG
jgi:hypothetical protein